MKKPIKRWQIVIDINNGEYEESVFVNARNISIVRVNIVKMDNILLEFSTLVLRINPC